MTTINDNPNFPVLELVTSRNGQERGMKRRKAVTIIDDNPNCPVPELVTSRIGQEGRGGRQ